MNSVSFEKDGKLKEKLSEWWKKLDENKGERALLRRCHALNEILITPTYYHFRLDVERVLDEGNEKVRLSEKGLATVLGLLACVKEEGKRAVPKQMAEKDSGEKPRVSKLRFSKLMKTTDQNNFFMAMRRLLRLMNNTADLYSLAQGAYYWNEQTRRIWAKDYYTA